MMCKSIAKKILRNKEVEMGLSNSQKQEQAKTHFNAAFAGGSKDEHFTCECSSTRFHIRKDLICECAFCLNEYAIVDIFATISKTETVDEVLRNE